MTQPSSTVNVPAVGAVSKRTVYVGGAVVAVLVGYMYWRHRKNAAAATTSVDTTTGTVGDTGFVNPVPNAVGGGQTIDTTGGTAVTDNATWTQKVLADFQSQGGIYDPLFASETLGKYLDGQALTQDEANLVRAAWGLEGHPPQGSPVIVMTTTASTPGAGTSNPGPAPDAHQAHLAHLAHLLHLQNVAHANMVAHPTPATVQAYKTAHAAYVAAGGQ